MASYRGHRTGRFEVELLPRAAYDAAYTAEQAVVGFAFEAQRGVHAFGSDRRSDFTARPNGLAYIPVGCDVYSSSEAGGEYLRIALISSEDAIGLGERRFSDVIDPSAIAAARRLRALLMIEAVPDPLGIEALAAALISRALRTDAQPPRAAAWMTGRRLAQIDELIEDRLDDRLSVQHLAVSLGLSAGFFARAFKAAVGQSPHDYIIDRRLARARRMIASLDMRLDEIALASGFLSHAHMSATFRNRFGFAPSQLRRSGKPSPPKA